MFPIIPSAMLNQSSPTSTIPFPLLQREPKTEHWSAWTENSIRSQTIYSEMKFACNTKRTSVEPQRCESTSKTCVAASFLPKNSVSKIFFDIENCDKLESKTLYISIDANARLSCSMADENQWLNWINISKDTHSNNATLEIVEENKLIIRTVKNVAADEEIFLWFSEEVLAQMDVPFLTPSNIQGKNCYKCTECEKVFEYPNPLKLHIASSCERLSRRDLWNRLTRALDLTRHPTEKTERLSNYVNRLNFVPTLYAAQEQFTKRSLIPPSNLLPYFPTFSPPSTVADMPTTASNGQSIASAAAQLETIVSNMGTSKQGHVCIYCGKLYSRKYGLKIHIRTHTGYKPLKCKFCLRPFGDPSNLNKHIRLHVQERSLHKCTLCNKIVARRRDLLRHMHIKHNRSLETSSIDGADVTMSASPTTSFNDGSSHCSGMSDASSCNSVDEDNDDMEPLQVD